MTHLKSVAHNMITLFAFALSAGAFATDEPTQPESGFSTNSQTLVTADKFMISAANPLAVQAGYDVLERGGTAMDAAITTQFVLNLVEPQSSGIGGGAFLIYYEKNSDTLHTLDGREEAPASIRSDHFLQKNGEPIPWWDRITGGQSVGIPGTMKLLEEGYNMFGKASWRDLVTPAIKLAENGFPVSPRMSNSIQVASERGLKKFEVSRNYFFDENGTALAPGHLLKNPQLAETFRAILVDKSKAFYEGELAQKIVDAVNDSAPGFMTKEDLREYRVKKRPAICAPYRGYRACGMGPPSSGALTVGATLGILNQFTIEGGSFTVDHIKLISEAQKLAYADRNYYIADSDFENVPVSGLLDSHYLQARSALIDKHKPMLSATAGNPPAPYVTAYSPDKGLDLPGTTHLSIVDSYGNILSMTSTIESGFGSRIMVGGFLLNNELTDFSVYPSINGKPVANRIEAGKRPRSSMAPTIVFDALGKPFMAVGSPGGSRIINYVTKTIIGVIDLELDIQSAISTPHFSNRNGTTDLEKGESAASIATELNNVGQETQIRDLNSGLHAIVIGDDGKLSGGADQRREGLVMGL